MTSQLPYESTAHDSHVFSSGDKSYDVYKLIRLTAHIPSIEMETARIKDQILDECWTDTEDRKLSPHEVLSAYLQMGTWEAVEQKHPTWREHIRRTRQADYSYPVLMNKDRVIDGMHRIIHALADEAATMMVRVLDELPEEAGCER